MSLVCAVLAGEAAGAALHLKGGACELLCPRLTGSACGAAAAAATGAAAGAQAAALEPADMLVVGT